jgi:hypothetical protein
MSCKFGSSYIIMLCILCAELSLKYSNWFTSVFISEMCGCFSRKQNKSTKTNFQLASIIC